MEKIELKYLAPYLPHDLDLVSPKFSTGGRSKLKMECRHLNESGLIHESYKPVLRPLSNLIKEIEHNGEKFMPIHNLSELFNTELNMDSEDTFLFGNTIDGGVILSIMELHYDMMLLLFEWHFDVFGLIEKGLAIDVNTL